MPPKEYNLKMEAKLSGKAKDWDPFNETFLTNLMDNSLEFVADYASIYFDAIQSSQKPGGEIDMIHRETRPDSLATPSTARRLVGRGELRGIGVVGENDDEDTAGPSSGPSANTPTDKIVLTPSMLGDPKYRAVWEKIMKNSPMGDMLEQVKDVRQTLLSAHNPKYNDPASMGVTTREDLKPVHKRMLGQIMRTVNQQVVRSLWASCLNYEDKSPEQDALRGIITTKEIKENSLGRYFDPYWADNPQEMLAILLYVALL